MLGFCSGVVMEVGVLEVLVIVPLPTQVQESMQGKGSSRRKSMDRMSPAQRISLRRSIRSHAERDS